MGTTLRGGWGLWLLLTLFTGQRGIAATEGFESGDMSAYPWRHAGASYWAAVSTVRHSGSFSAKAGTISGNSASTLEVSVPCSPGTITFWRKVSSELGFDALSFYIDGVVVDAWSGEKDWEQVSYQVAGGSRTFRWTYSKNVVGGSGSDTAWLDDIEFPSATFWADLAASPKQGLCPVQVVFQASSHGTQTNDVHYWWDFQNDGTWDADGLGRAIVTNTFSQYGAWSVCLMASNAAGEVFTHLAERCVTAGVPAAFVSPRGGHVQPFSDWSTAATNIESALAVAVAGTVIEVTNGTYSLSEELVLRNGSTVRSVSGPEHTTVDGGDLVCCFHLAHSNAVVQGFTITRGRAGRGGGVFCAGGGTVRDCVISNNVSSTEYGGYGLHWGGGGVFCDAGGYVVDCVIVSNTAKNEGGGVFCEGGGEVRNCIIARNYCHDDGGGVALNAGGILANCLLAGNVAGDNGGGLQTSDGGLVQNCTIVSNLCSVELFHHGGGGIYHRLGGTLQNCILYNNRSIMRGSDNWYHYGGSHFHYCCTTPNPGGTANITSPPQFVDEAAENWRLMEGSAGIDKGLSIAGITSDLEGAERPLDGDGDRTPGWDIGCYERLHGSADSDRDGMTDAEEVLCGTALTDPHSLLRILSLQMTNDTARITWSTVHGKGYDVQRGTDLIGGSWTNIMATTVYERDAEEEGAETWLDALQPSHSPSFYRVLLYRAAP